MPTERIVRTLILVIVCACLGGLWLALDHAKGMARRGELPTLHLRGSQP